MGRPGEGNRDGENVLCPLFVAYSENEIRCHALIPDSSATIHRYGDRRACWGQRKMYCEGNYKRCEHYLSWLHFRWEDDEE